MKSALSLAVIWLLAAATGAAAQGTPIPSGRYTCIAGSSRMMLTLGEMVISDSRYVFTAPTGPSTSGVYSVVGPGYRWSGDIGAITNAQIVDSGPEPGGGNFWFTFKARPTSLPTTTACQRL